ncbi:MAG: DUF6786 family protein, partial [Planctomycetota bacterium]
MAQPTYHDDVEFLSAHTDVVTLSAGGPARVAVTPQWQGRVMTSTPSGPDGAGLG